MSRISKHISYKEATYSPTAERKGITNSPEDFQIQRMIDLAENVFEPCREYFKEPIYINSFFRSITLNSVIGGSTTSQHCAGEAFDIRLGHNSEFSNKDLFDFIKDNLEFDQLIWEFGNDNEPKWIHVSYRKEQNRKQVLRAKRIDGKVRYNTHI
jgi:pectate lyase